jgi:hypothetical protein
MPHSNDVIYYSDLVIRDPVELNTYCIFYDKVWLPYTTQRTSQVYLTKDGAADIYDLTYPPGLREQLMKVDFIRKGSEKFKRDYIHDTTRISRQQKSLFDEKVLERLPAPPKAAEANLSGFAPSARLGLFAKMPCHVVYKDTKPSGEVETVNVLIRRDLALHWLRTDIETPRLISGDEQIASRDFMVLAEAREVFSYLLPAVLPKLNPDQILEIRRRVRDTRQGFSMHLQKLSKGVSDRMKGGESPQQVISWARSIVETELVPDYYEFRRQLGAERSGFWKKVADSLEKVAEIDAAFWTPKFYFQLLKALGFTALTYTSERKEGLSNKAQAFHFMRLIEGLSAPPGGGHSRLSPRRGKTR